MNKTNYKNLIFAVSLVLIASSAFVFGVYASEKKIIVLPFLDSNVAVAATEENTDLELFFNVWNTLKDKSIYYADVKDEDRIYGAIQGLAASLGDPYTTFMPPQESKEFNESISGSFDGIGAELGKKDNVLTIIAPIKGSPAERAGIISGDKIIKINGVLASDTSIEEAVSQIRGKKGTPVKLTIYRDGEKDVRDIEIIRDTIVIPTMTTEIVNGVFVVHIYNFGEHVTEEFEKAIKEFKKSGSQDMLLDLRGNPGGYLEAAVDISSYFVPKGKTIVSEDLVKKGSKQVHTSYGYTELKDLKNVVVLVDGGSASASEILAGALRDHGVAKIVGVKTFGKGSVQELLPMKEGTSLKVTIARWLTPSGGTIDKNGIEPDVEVKREIDEKNPKYDNQLEKAISVLRAR